MIKYVVNRSSGKLLVRLYKDPHPDWQQVEERLIESSVDIPSDEVGFWTWNGMDGSLAVDELARYKYRCLRNAFKWKNNSLVSLNWGNLSSIEKKLIMKVDLTEQDQDELLILWVAAGSPEE